MVPVRRCGGVLGWSGAADRVGGVGGAWLSCQVGVFLVLGSVGWLGFGLGSWPGGGAEPTERGGEVGGPGPVLVESEVPGLGRCGRAVLRCGGSGSGRLLIRSGPGRRWSTGARDEQSRSVAASASSNQQALAAYAWQGRFLR
jgi:hypothetical protein